MSRIFYILYLLFPVICYSQNGQYNSKVAFAVETYAFLKGQNAALAKVAAQFPHLKPNVAAAEKSLKIVFGRAEKNIQQFLKEELNTVQLHSLQNQIDSLLNQQLVHPIEEEKHAHDFLLKLKERSTNLNNEMLSKGILSFKYHDAPHQEIADGHVDFFSTENHPKAEKISLKIPIPKSWLAQEAQMPETIQQFTSYHGNGNEKILIVVYDLPEELHGITLTEKSVAALLPPQTKLLRTEPLAIDNLPAFMIEVEESIKHQNDSMKVRMLQFMFLQNQKLYCLQGSIGPVKADEDMGLEIKKYEPLFRLIASKAELDN
ncbi:hypothetical protein [Flavobacterium hungaricum]|uniref:Uncharacterized protein n=1 Tax=Flavobacterium hungaricum TaxID=2082725 RepID=A0ABR9TKR0_9FLAO|nr:hypothetical protein [Flavobacterium hungaricum]MBE8725955.1 hypothetical protein [Flavobacterium hungaricum]